MSTEDRDPQASALLVSHGILAEQIGAMQQTLSAINTRLAKGDERMTRIEAGLQENTELTRDFAAARAGARALRTVMVWAGGIAGGAVGIWTLVKAVVSHGSDIGPTP